MIGRPPLMRPEASSSAATVVAVLGPTNTGKTHQAIERMLEHDSGMIGLPLRLLAREVYDRISARLGEAAVALVTGEERRISGTARYWVCTVEAMPPDLAVDFVAVDEIQLAAHWERGHIFCDRLLHMRGKKETWFLGSDTIRPLLRTLVPNAQQRSEQRFSQLRAAGSRSLRSLPRRSAVVAFSIERVYELAERLRYLRGGAAVVLGALSPRTRNAQVALYQAGEVEYMVATDAIGMGLNLDLDHVGFADLRKFDGRQHRPLLAAELAQIAGRAGRYRNDGSFGTVAPLPPLEQRVALDIEEHRFPPLHQLMWRSSTLDFSSIAALLDSLAVHPQSRHLQRTVDSDDTRALRELGERREIRDLACDPASVAQLWEVCQVPDFEKLLVHRHVDLLGEIFRQLCRRGTIDADWLRKEVEHVDSIEGGIDMLTTRLSLIRRWTYVSHRSHWLEDARYWQERSRAIEDRLGDALHHCLMERFVERTRRWSSRRPTADKVEPSSPFARLRELQLPGSDAPSADEAWVQRLVDASHADLRVDSRHHIRFEDEPIGRLVPGRSLLEPVVQLSLSRPVGPGARRRIERRLLAFGRDLVAELMAPLRSAANVQLSRPGHGLIYQLEQNLGTIARQDAAAQVDLLTASDRAILAELHIRAGRHTLYAAPLVTPNAIRLRRVLYALVHPDVAQVPGLELGPPILDLYQGLAAPTTANPDREPPAEPSTSADDRVVLDLDLGERDYLSLGYLRVSDYALRADTVEELARRFAPPKNRGDSARDLAAWLGLSTGDLRAILSALGYSLPRRKRRPARSRHKPGGRRER